MTSCFSSGICLLFLLVIFFFGFFFFSSVFGSFISVVALLPTSLSGFNFSSLFNSMIFVFIFLWVYRSFSFPLLLLLSVTSGNSKFISFFFLTIFFLIFFLITVFSFSICVSVLILLFDIIFVLGSVSIAFCSDIID